ncbi:uncharacterized protein PV07_07865 [Cladophialophora immunda]|uniref:Uncharacterized protein n=1 Tax=Cladophialophora immunda TaxID=569365 RepID=A0A0D2CAT6_9EURO|nr:uncharacterized protein PV07_07865 [Cladophialophora immunda]KIW28183.1 hypothetical protein PV07_07865 [Cladophialophora immunda]
MRPQTQSTVLHRFERRRDTLAAHKRRLPAADRPWRLALVTLLLLTPRDTIFCWWDRLTETGDSLVLTMSKTSYSRLTLTGGTAVAAVAAAAAGRQPFHSGGTEMEQFFEQSSNFGRASSRTSEQLDQ